MYCKEVAEEMMGSGYVCNGNEHRSADLQKIIQQGAGSFDEDSG